VGPLLEGGKSPLVVVGHPGLHAAAAASQDPGDLGGGVALLGEDDRLVPEPDPFPCEGFGQVWKFFEGVMVLDKRRSRSWCDSEVRSILPNRHGPQKRGRKKFPEPV
jgi:hypothetical protein